MSGTVFVVGSSFANADKNYSRGKYHNDKNCQHLQKANIEYREVDKSKLYNYELCQWCDGINRSNPYDTQICEACGNEFKQLPAHILSCPER